MKVIWTAMIMGVILHAAHAQERYKPEVDGPYHKFVKKKAAEQQNKTVDSKSTVLIVVVDASKASDNREGSAIPIEQGNTRTDQVEKRKVFNSRKRCEND